jgi:hypothetical protein
MPSSDSLRDLRAGSKHGNIYNSFVVNAASPRHRAGDFSAALTALIPSVRVPGGAREHSCLFQA